MTCCEEVAVNEYQTSSSAVPELDAWDCVAATVVPETDVVQELAPETDSGTAPAQSLLAGGESVDMQSVKVPWSIPEKYEYILM